MSSKDLPNYPVPPEWTFKYRRSRTTPEQQVLEQEQTMFVGKGIKYPALHDKSDEELKALGINRADLLPVTKDDKEQGGQLLVYEGVPYASAGHPFPPALYGINAAKRVTLNMAKVLAGKDMALTLLGFALTPRKYKLSAITRAMHLYHNSMMMFIEPFVVEEHFCTAFTNELHHLIVNFFVSFGLPYFVVDLAVESLVMQFEYDNAYRFRVEDGMSMTTKERMMAHPAQELALVFRTMAERDHGEGQAADKEQMARKYKAFERLLTLAFWIPGVKKAFRAALERSNFKKLQPNKASIYFTLMWPDYQFGGKTQEERWQIYKEIHKDGLPPRLVWRKPTADEIATATQVATPSL